jgi:hypothetical protein
MAKTTIVRITDDLDGSAAQKTVSFSFEGKSYEIDLSKKNATALEKALKPYIEAARRVRRPTGRATGRSGNVSLQGKRDLNVIRAWARANGYMVADRGRIPVNVVEAFESAN